jgi:hypothetical protein
MVFLLLVFLGYGDALAATKPPSVRELVFRLAQEIEGAGKGNEWLTERASLSPLERSLLKHDPRLPRSPRPRIEVKQKGLKGVVLRVDGLEADFTSFSQGEVFINGKRYRIDSGLGVYEFAAAISGTPYLANPPIQGKTQSDRMLFSIPGIGLAFADPPQAITRGCASRDYFTYIDVVNSPFGFAPPIWISAAVISITRWFGNQFRSCDRHVEEIQELLRKNRIAIRSLGCGSDQWGTDREIEFWLDEIDASGKNRTARFDLDYNNYFAVERDRDGESTFQEQRSAVARKPTQRLYVFSESTLKEVRVLEDKGSDFLGGCRSLRDVGRSAADRAAFARERDRMEKFRQIFAYIGRHNSCTACPSLETRVVSPRPPSFFQNRGAAPSGAEIVPAGPADSSGAR